MTQTDDRDINNGIMRTLSRIIKHVLGSAGESEFAALSYNYKAAIPLKMILQEMGHQQPTTPTVTRNALAEGLINKTTIPKRAKNCDLRFNLINCREAQTQFDWI